jgi:hypothetical protein
MSIFEHVATINAECQSPEVNTFHAYSPEEIAYAMAGLDRMGSIFVKVKYALWENEMPELSRRWWLNNTHLMDKPRKETVRKVGNMALAHVLRNNPAFLDKISRMALDYCIDHHVCGACGGRSSIVLNAASFNLMSPKDAAKHKIGEVIVCAECAGVGRRPQSMKQRARIAEIPSETWRRNWEPVFKHMVDELVELERGWANIMRNRLRWGD